VWPACLALLLLSACLTPNPPDVVPVGAREVSFESAGYRLTGTLSSPGGRPARAGILIIPGSGPIDRDGVSRTAPPTPPVYRRWAEGLGGAGFAVLRYDKRFLSYPDVDITTFDQEAQIVDAVAAVAFLRGAPEVAGRKLFVIGHSEGGTLAPVVAARVGSIAGLIIINTVVFSVDELLVAQVEANPTIPRSTVSEVRDLFVELKNGSFPPRGLLYGGGASYWTQWIAYSSNAPTTLSQLPMPLLLVQCLSDATLPGATLGRNLDVLRTVAARNANARLRELRGHDHLGMLPGEPEPSPELMDTLIDWLLKASTTR